MNYLKAEKIIKAVRGQNIPVEDPLEWFSPENNGPAKQSNCRDADAPHLKHQAWHSPASCKLECQSVEESRCSWRAGVF